MGGKSFGGLTFLHNIKPSSFGDLKTCIGGGFWSFGGLIRILQI